MNDHRPNHSHKKLHLDEIRPIDMCHKHSNSMLILKKKLFYHIRKGRDSYYGKGKILGTVDHLHLKGWCIVLKTITPNHTTSSTQTKEEDVFVIFVVINMNLLTG